MQSVAMSVMSRLKMAGVDTVFGYPGQSNLLLLHAVRACGMRYVQTMDERAAGFAAIGYIQASERPAAVCVSKGPAATNLLTPLYSAMQDGVPLIVIAGSSERGYDGLRPFQCFDAAAAFLGAGAVKMARRVWSESELQGALADAIDEAWSEPCGPTVLELPSDILFLNVNESAASVHHRPTRPVRDEDASLRRVEQAAKVLAAAARPLMLVGSGARRDFLAIRSFGYARQIPAVHTIGGTGVVPTSSPLYGGLLRHNGSPEAAYLVQRADVILALGTGLDERATAARSDFAKGATIIHVDIQAEALRRGRADLAIEAALAPVLERLEQCMPRRSDLDGWRRELEQAREWRPQLRKTGRWLTALEVVSALAEAAPAAIVVKDSGSHKYWAARHLPCQSPLHSVGSYHFGTMGFGLPAALGASVANPEEIVLAVCGDGGALMALPELVTLSREHCDNLRVFVFNNAGLGSTRDYEARICPERAPISDYGHHLPIAKYAEALGVQSCVVADRSGLEECVERLKKPGLMLFDCILDPEERMAPSIPYSERLEVLAERALTEYEPT